VSDDSDRDGARCQSEALRDAIDLFATLWKEALTAKKNALKGSNRVTGSDPRAPVTSDGELAGEIVAVIQGDAKGKIAKTALKMRDKVSLRCAPASTPLAQMFPGACSAAATLDALGACLEGIVRGQFYTSLASADVLAIDCDLRDNGASDLSCASPELVEHVLNRTGYGANAWTRARIQALGVHGYIEE